MQAFGRRDQTVPKSVEMSFSPVGEQSVTTQPIQAQDSSLHSPMEEETQGADHDVTDLKTPLTEGAAAAASRDDDQGNLYQFHCFIYAF